METLTQPNLSEIIGQAKQSAEMTNAGLLRTFSFVPDDKLTWSPSGTCRSALAIVAHCGILNGIFAATLRGETIPVPPSPAEAIAYVKGLEAKVTTREAAIAMIEDSHAQVMKALDGIQASQLETSPMSPFGPLPFAFWMQLPTIHTNAHSAQIDYLQTIWGDLDLH
jgi:hypothetical protein